MSQEYTQEKWNYTDFNMENHDITFDGEGKQSVLISIPFERDTPECVKEKLNEIIGLGMAEWLRCGTLDGLLKSWIPNPKDLLLNARMQINYNYDLGVQYLITIVITSIYNDVWIDKDVAIQPTDKLLHSEFASYCRYKLDKILFSM